MPNPSPSPQQSRTRMHRFSPSRLVAYTQCAFKPRIEAFRTRRVADVLELGPQGALDEAYRRAAAGDDFEDRYLARLEHLARTSGQDNQYVRLVGGTLSHNNMDLKATIAAMRNGTWTIAQAPLAASLDDAEWHGIADLLVRTDKARAEALSLPWRYQVVDIKLARNASAAHLTQLAVYAEMLDVIQGPWIRNDGYEDAVEHVGLVTGGERTGAIHDPSSDDILYFERSSISAIGRVARRSYVRGYGAAESLAAACASEEATPTLAEAWDGQYPEPTPHCAVCDFATACAERRDRDDHASLVAGLARRARRALQEAGVAGHAPLGELTVADVGELGGESKDPEQVLAKLTELVQRAQLQGVTGISPAGAHNARQQAQLQLRQQAEDRPLYELVPPDHHPDPGDRGFAILPAPSRFDLFFDLEGYPNGGISAIGAADVDHAITPAHGLEYLWGITSIDQLDPTIDPGTVDEPSVPTPNTHAGVDHRDTLTDRPENPARQPGWEAWWAHDAREEQHVLQAVLDRIAQARAAATAAGEPAAHVYHYGHYEVTRLKQLTTRYGIGEALLSDMLRDGVFIDLYRIAHDVVRVGARGFSIKQLEPHYRPKREGTLGSGTSAIVYYHRWATTPPSERTDEHEQWLREIAHYNRDDCVSTWQLRQWLLRLLDESNDAFGPWPEHVPAEEREPTDQSEARAARRAQMHELADQLVAEIDPPPATADELTQLDDDARARWIMAGLLRFHAIEDSTSRWEYYARQTAGSDERFRDPMTITGIRVDSPLDVHDDGSGIIILRAPNQPYRQRAVRDAETLGLPRPIKLELVALDHESHSDELVLTYKVGTSAIAEHGTDALNSQLAQIEALHGISPIFRTDPLEQRLLELAQGMVAGAPANQLAMHLLLREPPLFTGTLPDTILDPESGVDAVGQLVARARTLDGSYLAIQGPPGTGKTYTSARMICAIIHDHRQREAVGEPWQRVGIAAPGHKVIDNLVEAVARCWAEEYADEEPLRILRRPKDKATYEALSQRCTELGAIIHQAGNNQTAANWLRGSVPKSRVKHGPHDLVAGTVNLFAAPELCKTVAPITGSDRPLSHLFVDEAGQMTLAALLPAVFSTDSVVLVGDPQQLPQVTVGTHPVGANESILRHLMGRGNVISPTLGALLNITRRMHPDICRYVSTTTYRGQLIPAKLPGECDTSLQRVDVAEKLLGRAAGCVWKPVEHKHRSTSSPEEASIIVELCEQLLGSPATNSRGGTFTIGADDILLVSPYNDQVDLLSASLAPLGITRIGTVDRFQGQEAPLTIISLASSDRESCPRGLGFLIDYQRLNVAVSRARTLTVLVASPGLLSSSARSVDDLVRLNALAAFIEAGA